VAPRIAPPDPLALDGLEPATRALLRELALRALAALGMRQPGATFVEEEMLRQFGRIAPAVADGDGREERLRASIRAATEALDEE
jgi:hypothetical protein